MLFTFPSQYWFTIGLSLVFSLAGWARPIQTGFHVSRLTQDITMHYKLTCTGLSPSLITFSNVFHFIYFCNIVILLPRHCRNNGGLGCSPVARRYWGNHYCFIFLQVLRCFSSLRLASSCLCIRHVIHGYDSVWVPPFGYRRLFTCLPLTVAFRCLLRPSSPECA